MTPKKRPWLSFFLVLTTATFMGSCSQLRNLQPSPQPSEPSPDSEQSSPQEDLFSDKDRPLERTPEDTNFVTTVVDEMSPAVVRVNVKRVVETNVPDVFNNPFFERFFGDSIPIPPQQRVQQGLGSGFIVSSDGQILTNAHVVNKADEVVVALRDGRTFDGTVVGEDPLTDIAVIQIDAEDLPTVPLGNSDTVKPGQWAIAIGNPLGLNETVTVGVISATGRPSSAIGVSDKRVEFIQTDAAINPGNSGGPLLNARGEVIAINTAIIGQAEGLGFAVPINTAKRVAKEILETGEVQYPYIGIRMVTLSPEIKQQLEQLPRQNLDITAEAGVLIVETVQGSPASQAGLQSGDVIREMNGDTVETSEQVQRIVEQQSVGDRVTLLVERNGQTQEITVELERLPVDSNR
ncbi:HtrA2 peptidase [Halothece sp. PCC 7418]|uniref:HhoA/HhoB/HtrA family serine endopeptidase n=1 Tax=Halothece sp. (strain PCC 7418) TaxID=65093 RepID=UPI0002A0709A|nr:HhoA/HhoB/HtrA family serine endopeptidase [Halothece sp. PCC 7418]AFZ45664.1 HtrA2 peptidase [Halothece sp. PCC 7418]